MRVVLRTTMQKSLSSSESTRSILAVLSLLALSLNDSEHEHPFKKKGLDKVVASLIAEAKPQLRSWGILSDFGTLYKAFVADGYRLYEDVAYEFSTALKEALPKIQSDVDSVSAPQLDFFKKLRTFYSKDSAPAWKYIIKNVKSLGYPEVSGAFLPFLDDLVKEVDHGPVDLQRMREIAKVFVKAGADMDRQMGKTPNLKERVGEVLLTPLERNKYREKYPKLHAEYSALAKALDARFKTELRKFVRSSGRDKVKVQDAAHHLTKLGCNAIPEGFVGLVDEDNNYYTVKGLKLNASVAGRVIMNPAYDPAKDNTYVCSSTGSGSKGRKQEWRTLAFLAKKATARHDAVKTAGDKVDKLRQKWARDLKNDGSFEQVVAALVEVAYTTLARIGGLNNKTEDGETTYGLSTLLVEHVKVDAKGAHFDYAGKKGTGQPATLYPRDPVTKKTIQVIKELMRGKSRKDFLFTFDGKRITANDANRYMKELGFPTEFTIHKFRHLAGTKMFYDIVKDAPFKKGQAGMTQSAVEKWYRNAMIPIGEALHHRNGEKVTGMTAVGAYISLEPQRDFFKDLGLREPNFLAKKKAA